MKKIVLSNQSEDREIKLYSPTCLYFGVESLSNLEFKNQNILCLCSKNFIHDDNLMSLISDAVKKGKSKIKYIIKKGNEPSSNYIDELKSSLTDKFDTILGIGGGSVMDSAKYLGILINNGGTCTEYEFGNRRIDSTLTTYLIPTTSGTGSEVTNYTVIKNSKSGRKFTISNINLFPEYAFVDPKLTLNLPYYTSVSSGMDAFIHNLEVLLNENQNKLINPIAASGAKLAFESLPKLYDNMNDITIRTKLALSSVMGGLAIANSRTGLIHTLSVAFAEFVDIPHGLLNTILTPYAIRSNIPYFNGKLSEVFGAIVGKNFKSDSEAFSMLDSWIENILLKIERPIIKKGIIENNLEHMIKRVLQDEGLHKVNQGPINEECLEKIFTKILNDT